MSSLYWFAPAPAQVSSQRLSLDFDLRSADLFYRELVVPELGRIWFARQLSWPVAALALHEELAGVGSNPPKPTAICHGIVFDASLFGSLLPRRARLLGACDGRACSP